MKIKTFDLDLPILRCSKLGFTKYKNNVPPERNTDWHIGGKQKFVAHLVNIYFSAR